MEKFTLRLKIWLFCLLGLVFCAFSDPESITAYIDSLQKSFTDHYDADQEMSQVKRYEFNVTNNGFCRYKRYFGNGKTEYFSFKLSKFKDMDYVGTTVSGQLYLYTKGDDIIVQTYKDKGGDVDSMTTRLMVPLKNMEPEDLNLIRENLTKICSVQVK